MQKRDRNGVKIAVCKKKKWLVSILGLGRFLHFYADEIWSI